MVAHNNQLPNNHFHKDWQLHVKTWFNQPGKKLSRRNKREKKASLITPRPLDMLRPAVRCPTIKYNRKLRKGRGFTLAELKEAGIKRKEALTIGISVDHRRRNRSLESLQLNSERLYKYKQQLVLFPRNPKKPKEGDSGESIKSAVQVRHVFGVQSRLDGEKERVMGERVLGQYETLRKARSDKKLFGQREKKRKDKEAEEAERKK